MHCNVSKLDLKLVIFYDFYRQLFEKLIKPKLVGGYCTLSEGIVLRLVVFAYQELSKTTALGTSGYCMHVAQFQMPI